MRQIISMVPCLISFCFPSDALHAQNHKLLQVRDPAVPVYNLDIGNRQADVDSIHMYLHAVGGMTTYFKKASSVSNQDPNLSEGLHLYYGGMFEIRLGGWGLLGLGQLGSGRGYDSELIGGALSREVIRVGRARLSLLGGYSYYGETSITTRRETGAFLYGAMISVDVNPLVLTGAINDLYGRYSKQDVPEPFTFHAPRVMLGVAFNLSSED